MADQPPNTIPAPVSAPPPLAAPTLAPLPVPPRPVATIPPPPPLATIPPPSSSAAPVAADDGDRYVLSDAARLAKERQEKAIQDLLLKRRAFAMAVPTNDSAVRTRLRRLGEPITLFGEREMERRDRLRSIMVRLEADGKLDVLLSIQEEGRFFFFNYYNYFLTKCLTPTGTRH